MKPELLAPAGGEPSLKAAVYAGADAVYFGAEQFSARANAQNFEEDQLKSAVDFCHSFGVKAYLAMNTLITDRQWGQAAALVELACEIGVDAFIVQDIGLAAFVRRSAPKMPIHASTQMSIHTPKGAYFLKQNGFSRVVLAREMSLDEIAQASKEGIPTEVFIHGALCFSVSGQCFLSGMLGTRSANRGVCAQPCRLPFSASGRAAPDLSLKDLCAAESLDALVQAGVSSLKIEGRNKRPEYVAAATVFYRALLDHTQPPISLSELQSVFSRDGFTNGYIKNERGGGMFGVRSRKDEPAPGLYAKLRELYRRPAQRIPLKAELEARAGERVCLTLTNLCSGKRVQKQGEKVERARKQPVEREQIALRLEKLGGTPYFLKEAEIRISPDAFLPAAEINRLRNSAAEALARQSCSGSKVSFSRADLEPTGREVFSRGRLRAQCQTWEQIVRPERFELIALGPDELLRHLREAEPLLPKLAVAAPRAMFGREKQVQKQLAELRRAGIRHMVVQNLAHIALGEGFILHGGLFLNITNRWAARQLKQWGVQDCVLSPECSLQTLRAIQSEIPCGIFAAGRMPLMLARNCPVKKLRDCAQCGKKATLTDRLGKQFPVLCSGETIELLNADLLWMGDRPDEWKTFAFAQMQFTIETAQQAAQMADRFDRHELPRQKMTRGLYYRGI